MITERPTWLYRPVTVENLAEVQQQCQAVFANHYANIFADGGLTFHYLDRDLLKIEAPAYVEAIANLGLLDRWGTSVFVGTTGERHDIDSLVPIDTEDWLSRCYAFNMPVQNCDESWTVWYECSEWVDVPFVGDSSNYKTAKVFKIESCREIDRWPASQPAWINVTTPHRPVSNHTKTRLLISTRFWPEVHDILGDANLT